MVYYKPKPAHDWKITDNDVLMMHDNGMYKDPVKLNAFMNHASLTFAVGVHTRINRYLQDVTDQPDNDNLKSHACLKLSVFTCVYQSTTVERLDSANPIII